MEELSIFASDVRVRVRAPRAELLADLRALWSGCASPLVATRRQACIAITQREAGYTLELSAPDGSVPSPAHAATESADDITPLAEALLYRVVHAASPSSVLLHAACVTREGVALIMLGPSGAGKSSFALAALERGYRYFTDELTLSDGRRVWGVPRAIQFEPVTPELALPARLANADRALYRVRLSTPGAAIASVPVRVPRAPELAGELAQASTAHVVRLVHGALDRCEPLGALEALVELHEAAFRAPHLDLGALTGPSRAHRLTWRDPARALEQLEAVLSPRATTLR